MSLDADVLLLSAGFGERLKPITDTLPKPLVKVGGRTMIDRNLELIARSGFKKVFINLHHLGSQIREFVGDGSAWGLSVVYVEEEKLLDTGGAIKNIESQLRHRHLVTVNSDILIGPDLDLNVILKSHVGNEKKPMVTMVLRHDPRSGDYGEIGINHQGRVVSFLGERYGPGEPEDFLMFLGVLVIGRLALGWMPERGSVFSITGDAIREILKRRGVIYSYVYDGFWRDIGTPQRLNQASKDLVALAEAEESVEK